MRYGRLKSMASADVDTPSVNTLTIFKDSTDSQFKAKDSAGVVENINLIQGTYLTTGTDTYLAVANDSALVTNGIYVVTFGLTNTGAATLNINAIGAKTISSMDGAALAAADLKALVPYLLLYDGTKFVNITLNT